MHKSTTFDLRHIPAGAAIRFLAAEVFTEPRLPLALVRYSLGGEEQHYGLRLDLDKGVFLDHFDEHQVEAAAQQAAPEIVRLLAGVVDIPARRAAPAAVGAPAELGGQPAATPEEFLAALLIPAKKSDHICWQCKHMKPVLQGSSFPPADLVGWCMKIHWPFYWCLTEANVVRKCYVFERKQVTVRARAAHAARESSNPEHR